MFVIGICVGPSDRYARIAEPSIRRWMPDTRVIALRDQDSISAAYNTILDEATVRGDVEGVILMHDDVEITDTLCERLHALFEDRSIGLVGVVGGAGRRRGMAWFSCEHWLGDVDGRGFAEPDSHSWGDVDVVDGFFMAVSGEVARTTRFDLRARHGFHGYDAELSSLVRASGRSVVVHPLPVRHVNAGMYGTKRSYVSWARTNLEWRAKWISPTRRSRLILRTRVYLMPIELRLRPAGRRRLRRIQ